MRYPRYKSFDGEAIMERVAQMQTAHPRPATSEAQLLEKQTRASLDLLLERIGIEKYLTWCDERLAESDSMGAILQKSDDYLDRLSCGDCPFDFDPGMCGICHEHQLHAAPECTCLPGLYSHDLEKMCPACRVANAARYPEILPY